MTSPAPNFSLALAAWTLLFSLLGAPQAMASGTVGEHVNEMSAHLDDYAEEVEWLIGKIDGIVAAYAQGGKKVAGAEQVVDHWEAVDFHSAIETHYIPLYSKIWQGLFGVRLAIEEGESVENVRAEQEQLERVLWQSLGAVKIAAQYQERGLLKTVETTGEDTPVETIDVIKQHLDRAVAKYAEQLSADAIAIVQNTYLELFEGIEGALIELDAELVEDLELDFNVTLQKAIEDGYSVDDVRAVVIAMQKKLDRAKSLLRNSATTRSDVF